MVDWVVLRRVDEFLPCGKPDSKGTGLGVGERPLLPRIAYKSLELSLCDFA
jgi:hypothetical protein